MQKMLTIALLLTLLCLPAQLPAAPMDGMGHDRAAMAMNHEMAAPSAGRCTPMADDFYWLDYGGGMMGMGHGGGKPKSRDGEKKESKDADRTSRRTRLLRLKHNAFPPKGMPSMAMDGNLNKTVFWLETPDQIIKRIETKQPGAMRFASLQGGHHKIFAYLDDGVKNHLRSKYFSFYRYYSHGEKEEKQEPPWLNGDGYWNGAPEFQLEPLYRDDRQAYAAETGQQLRFRVTLRGDPVAGACVVMMTEKGWRNAKRTDGQGEVSFILIQESATGDDRARRMGGKYLAVARYQTATAGQYGGQLYADTRYTAALTLKVQISSLEWQSKETAFLLVAFTIVAAGAAIAVRRRRKKMPGQTEAA